MTNRDLVLGANGFLGVHLTNRLARQGQQVVAFDRFTSREPQFSEGNVVIKRGDFLNDQDLASALDGVDRVFHFLSTSTPFTSEEDPLQDVTSNVVQTIKLLQLCVRHEIKHVYFSSTGGAIYGNTNANKFGENHKAEPVSPYAIGKLTVERYLEFFRRKHGLLSTSLRISNPYGIGQPLNRSQGLIPIVLRQVREGQPITRYGDGSMVRDFIYVDDVIDMISNISSAEMAQDLYNLGSGTGSTINEVFDTIAQITQRPMKIVTVDQPESFVQQVVLDNSRYCRQFGTPRFTPLHAGIEKTWASIREEIS